MTVADWLVLALVGFSGLIGLWRGFVRVFLSISVWLVAIALAWIYGPLLVPWIPGFITLHALRELLASLVIFAISIYRGGHATRFGSRYIRTSGLGDVDRVFGILFGCICGLVVLLITALLLDLTPLRDEPWWQASWSIQQLLAFADWGLSRMEPGGQG